MARRIKDAKESRNVWLRKQLDSMITRYKSKSIHRSQLMFRNNDHEVHTVEVNKVALNR